MPQPQGEKTYLGDAVYAEFTDGAVILTTEDGVCVSNRIVLDGQVMGAMNTWLTFLKEKYAEQEDG